MKVGITDGAVEADGWIMGGGGESDSYIVDSGLWRLQEVQSSASHWLLLQVSILKHILNTTTILL